MNDRIAFLRTVAAFRSLSDRELEALASQFEPVRFRPRERILGRGDPADAMYLVCKGRVLASLANASGEETLTAHLGTGDILGEMALLTGEPRNADVHAASDVECLRLTRERVNELLKRHTAVASFLTTILGQRLLEGENIKTVGKYTITGELGEGGSAYVFEGRHSTLGTVVAIKMLSHELVYDERFARRFKAESRIMAELRHDNIVRVIDTEEAYATFFIIMEKVDGVDLARLLSRRGLLGYAETRSILRQLAAALDHAHRRGIVHRDVKPSNVLVEPGGRVKVTDFGIAQSTALDALADEGSVSGTPKFLSPEQALGRDVDGRSDIYSLGIVAFRMLTGQLPFEADDPHELLRLHASERIPAPREIERDVPRDLDLLVRKATAKRPEDRFQSARELVDLLDGVGARRRQIEIVYDEGQEEKVAGLLKKWRKQAGKVRGLQFREDDAPTPHV